MSNDYSRMIIISSVTYKCCYNPGPNALQTLSKTHSDYNNNEKQNQRKLKNM